MLVFSLIGCTNNSSAILPLSRIGTEGEISAHLEGPYTFAAAFAACDMVAHIKVGNWLAEDNVISSTYYEATVIECYKGENIKNIVLKQDGCSEWTMRGYPLFTAGNEFLLFLKSASSVDPKYVKYSDTFWIIGAFTTMLFAVESDSGDVYYMDHYGLLGQTMDVDINYASQSLIFNELYNNAVTKDPLLLDRNYSFPYVFSKADIGALINSL